MERVTTELCRTCKENAPRANTSKRKFKDCESCRLEKAVLLRKSRVNYHQLKGHINRPVSYYECGWRAGYLTLLNRHTAVIQPIGTIGTQPSDVYMEINAVQPEQSAKYPTLEDWAKHAGWKENKVKATLITPRRVTPTGVSTHVPTQTDSTGTPVESPTTHAGTLASGTEWNPTQAVELYQQGMKVADIAAHFGDKNKQNRVRKACRDAGVYKEK